jgi:oligoendopeptidase F
LAIKRTEIADKYKWDIASMYPDEAEWDKDYGRALADADAFADYAGRLGESGGLLLRALRDRDEIWRLAERVYVYARQRRDEDNTDAKYQAMADRVHTLMAQIAARTAFFEPEMTAMTEEVIAAFRVSCPELAGYDFVIRQFMRQKPHILSQKEEELLAKLSEVLGATNDIFAMINDADMKFGEIMGEDGGQAELTHGNYIKFMELKNRDVRRGAYEALYSAFQKQKNTLAAAYSANTKTDAIAAGIRHYPSSLAAALSGDNVNEGVYVNLIETVGKNLPALHGYLDVKRRALGLGKLAMYDVYVPIVCPPDERDIPFEDAVRMMKTALAPLGDDYVSVAVRGALGEGWVDVYENEGKSSGAYSFGCYDSKPFILMNYHGKLKDIFTLVHEMGHSMHSYYTRRAQPFAYGSHSIFTAEVASTVNENLLVRHLLAAAKTDAERAYYLNFYLEEFRTTLFRQTMFAEFEKLTHEAAERGEALTNEYLSELYGGLNEKYHGPSVAQDDFIRSEWSRIPHFYRAFYVYKYATGFSAAAAIAERILAGGPDAVADYMRFLTTGDSDDPIELLKIAGVDMGRPEPVADAMKAFAALSEDFGALAGK